MNNNELSAICLVEKLWSESTTSTATAVDGDNAANNKQSNNDANATAATNEDDDLNEANGEGETSTLSKDENGTGDCHDATVAATITSNKAN